VGSGDGPGRTPASRAVTGARLQLDRSGVGPKNGAGLLLNPSMVSALSQTQILIALVVAAHAGVLAVRLSVSLFKA
jgi:photosystem I subunit XII